MWYVISYIVGSVVTVIFCVFQCRLMELVKALPDIKQMKIDIECNEENCWNTFNQLMELEKKVDNMQKSRFANRD